MDNSKIEPLRDLENFLGLVVSFVLGGVVLVLTQFMGKVSFSAEGTEITKDMNRNYQKKPECGGIARLCSLPSGSCTTLGAQTGFLPTNCEGSVLNTFV